MQSLLFRAKNRALQGAAHGPEKQSRSDAAGQSNVNTAGIASVSTSSTDSGKTWDWAAGTRRSTNRWSNERGKSEFGELYHSSSSLRIRKQYYCQSSTGLYTVCSIRQCSVFSRYIYRKKETVKYIHANMCQYKHPNRIKNVLTVTFCWITLNNMQV